MRRISPPRRGGWVSHCIEYYTYNMRKRKQNHITRVYCNPDAIKSRNVVRQQASESERMGLSSFRRLPLLASKYPAFPSMPFPPPLFFLFLFSCLYQNHLHLYCMFKLFTYLVFQCFINKKMMRFRRKKGVFSLQIQIKFVSL